jgi:hypothetical protein
MSINPDLGVPEIIALVRQATESRKDWAGDCDTLESVDEEKALQLARETLSVSIRK